MLYPGKVETFYYWAHISSGNHDPSHLKWKWPSSDMHLLLFVSTSPPGDIVCVEEHFNLGYWF